MTKDSMILITGKDGFVGNALYDFMIKNGYKRVHAIGRKELDLENQHFCRVYFSCREFDYVFHCAGKVGGIGANIKDPYNFLYKNLVIQNNIIDCCIKNKIKKVLFLGSSCVYPKDYNQPLKEEYLMKAPLEPTNEGYGIAKIAGLKMCEYANKTTSTSFISLMPSNLYGPGDSFDLETSHVLSASVKKVVDAKREKKSEIEIWGSGDPKREFLYIDDLVDAMIWTMKYVGCTDTFLNVGPGADISIKNLVFAICYATNYFPTIKCNVNKPDGMMKKCLDVSKINSYGWKAKTNLKEGIKKTIEYYESLLDKNHKI